MGNANWKILAEISTANTICHIFSSIFFYQTKLESYPLHIITLLHTCFSLSLFLQLYISEMAHERVRGTLGSCVQLMVVMGIMGAYITGIGSRFKLVTELWHACYGTEVSSDLSCVRRLLMFDQKTCVNRFQWHQQNLPHIMSPFFLMQPSTSVFVKLTQMCVNGIIFSPGNDSSFLK